MEENAVSEMELRLDLLRKIRKAALYLPEYSTGELRKLAEAYAILEKLDRPGAIS
jgi:hypothetical protein